MIPLLVETDAYQRVDSIVVVDAPESLQIERIMKRDNITLAMAQAIVQAQASREKRLAHTDNIIYNDGSLDQLSQQVQTIHQYYLHLPEQKTRD